MNQLVILFNFVAVFNLKDNIIDQQKLEEFIEREKEIAKTRKIFLKNYKRVHKPKFLEMIENSHKGPLHSQDNGDYKKFEVYKAKTMPLGNPNYKNNLKR